MVGHLHAAPEFLDHLNGLGVVGDDVGSLYWPAPGQSKEVQADAAYEDSGLGSTELGLDGLSCRRLSVLADFLAALSSLLDSRGVRSSVHVFDQPQLQLGEHFRGDFGLGLDELDLDGRGVHQAGAGQGLLAEVDDRLGHAAL